MTDADIAARIFHEAGLTDVKVDTVGTTHDHIGQCDQTDWDFLGQRAAEIGYELVVSEGTLCFRKASGVSATTGQPVQLDFNVNLWSFRPRVTAGNLAPEVEVRVWDPLQSKVLAHVVQSTTGGASVTGQRPNTLGTTFTGGAGPAAPPAAPPPAVGDLGPAPSTSAHVVHDRPVALGAAIDAAGEQAARAVAEHVASTFAEAEGEVDGITEGPGGCRGRDRRRAGPVRRFVAGHRGSPRLRHRRGRLRDPVRGQRPAGAVAARAGVGRCRAAAAVRADRRVLRRWSPTTTTRTSWPGSRWRCRGCRRTTSRTGPAWSSSGPAGRAGRCSCPRSATRYWSASSSPTRAGPTCWAGSSTTTPATTSAVTRSRSPGWPVRWCGGVSCPRAGNRLVFHDDVPPGEGNAPPTASDMVLGTGDGNLALAIDQTAGTVTLTCTAGGAGEQVGRRVDHHPVRRRRRRQHRDRRRRQRHDRRRRRRSA